MLKLLMMSKILLFKKKKYLRKFIRRTVKVLCDKHHPYLEILKIDGAQLTDKALDYIEQCHKLKSLMIEFCTNMTGLNFNIFQVDIFLFFCLYLIIFFVLKIESFEFKRIMFIKINKHSSGIISNFI